MEGQAEGVVPPRPEGQLRSTRVDGGPRLRVGGGHAAGHGGAAGAQPRAKARRVGAVAGGRSRSPAPTACTDPYRRLQRPSGLHVAVQLRLTGENRGVCGSGWAVGMLQATAGQREPSPGQRCGGFGPRQLVATIDPHHERCKNAPGRSFRCRRALQCRPARPCRPATGPPAVPVHL